MVGSSCRAPEAAGENEQCERLTEFQARTFAAFLLDAEQLPTDAVDPEIVPHWLSRADEGEQEGRRSADQAEGRPRPRNG